MGVQIFDLQHVLKFAPKILSQLLFCRFCLLDKTSKCAAAGVSVRGVRVLCSFVVSVCQDESLRDSVCVCVCVRVCVCVCVKIL